MPRKSSTIASRGNTSRSSNHLGVFVFQVRCHPRWLVVGRWPTCTVQSQMNLFWQLVTASLPNQTILALFLRCNECKPIFRFDTERKIPLQIGNRREKEKVYQFHAELSVESWRTYYCCSFARFGAHFDWMLTMCFIVVCCRLPSWLQLRRLSRGCKYVNIMEP